MATTDEIGAPATKPTRKISVFDLTLEQLERIERDIGLPLNSWQRAPSMGALARKILAQYHGTDEDTYVKLTLRELRAQVDLNPQDEDPDPF